MKIVTYQGIKVEVCALFTSGDGRKLAAIHAQEGQPFKEYTHGGWCCSSNAQVRADLLKVVDDGRNLLDMALEFADREQWPDGATLWLWGDKRRGAFLKNQGESIDLCLTGYPAYCSIFYLDLNGWTTVAGLNVKYEAWARKAAEVLK